MGIKQFHLVCTLQKQVGCFNHRVVALVADKLERRGYEPVALMLKTNCIRQPQSYFPVHLATTIHALCFPLLVTTSLLQL